VESIGESKGKIMSANSSSKGKRICESVEFRPAKGGVVSETRYKVARGGQGGGPTHDYEHESGVHATKEDAHAHLDKMMGGAWATGEDTAPKSEEEPGEK
jgi:hypothetical protein